MTDMELIDKAVQVISQLGFPIFVAGFLLFRMESAINKMTEALIAIKECLPKQEDKP